MEKRLNTAEVFSNGVMRRLDRLARHLAIPDTTGRPLPARTSGTNSRQPIFKPKVLAAFDSESYYRDGYWVFPSVMTDDARESWLSALQESDAINNDLTKQVCAPFSLTQPALPLAGSASGGPLPDTVPDTVPGAAVAAASCRWQAQRRPLA